MDQSAIEDLFERNADMRLLELRHGETGRTTGAVRHVAAGFGAESTVSSSSDVPVATGPRLRVAITAVPKAGVIPGALVGVAIDVFNDGTAPAPECRLVLSLPLEAEFRVGTLRVDTRDVPAPERLFGDGLPIARLPGATSAKVVFQLHVLAGLNPLYLQPRLQTNGVPVVGTPGISIKRAAAPGTRTAAEAERPFYELTDDETDATDVAAELPIVTPPAELHEASEAPQPEAAALDAPQQPAKRARRAVAPTPVPAPALVDEPPAATPVPAKAERAIAAADQRMSRFRTLGRNDIALLERLFAIEQPGIIAHFVMISTVACNEPEHGVDESGYAAFLRTDGETLGRALVLARLGKIVEHRMLDSSLDMLALPWMPTPPPTSTPRRSPRRLRRDLSETECRAIGGLVAPSQRDAQLRLRIALLALAGSNIEGVSRAHADECVGALTSYRSAVLAWLIPLCVASMTNATTTLPAPPANVDAAGRRVAAALRLAYAD